MNTFRPFLAALSGFAGSCAIACSCFGPTSFCATLNPPFPNPEWWIPESIVLGVKLGDYQHGMDVKVIQAFTGSLQVDDTVRVWGDCGLLCRHYPSTWAVGDTVVWGFRITDLAGNSLCGTSYEQPTDHMISICGIYYLDYANGSVTGPITSETIETMTLVQLAALVEDCLTTGSAELPASTGPVLWYDGDVPVIEWSRCPGVVDMRIVDMRGAMLRRERWTGTVLRMDGLGSGIYFLEAGTDFVCKVVVR